MTARELSKRSASPVLLHLGSNIAHELHALFLSLVTAYGGRVSERFPVRGCVHGDLIFGFIAAQCFVFFVEGVLVFELR
jgi:hypothetical protein